VILPDVNVLVYAFRRESPGHERYATWLNGVVGGSDELALHEGALAGFLRLVTSARIFAVPAPPAAAVTFADRLVGAPRSRWLTGSAATWGHLVELLRTDAGLSGNHLPDAVLAAAATTHGCRLATADRGFARYPGLDWFDPGRS